MIELSHISKEFVSGKRTVHAVQDVSLTIDKGEIFGMIGFSGAGKSTLMSVLFGMYQPEEGEIRKNGTPVTIRDPNDATALGIGMVHQHFKLIDVFSVLDNIILGAEDTKLGFLQKKKARQKVAHLLNTAYRKFSYHNTRLSYSSDYPENLRQHLYSIGPRLPI